MKKTMSLILALLLILQTAAAASEPLEAMGGSIDGTSFITSDTNHERVEVTAYDDSYMYYYATKDGYVAFDTPLDVSAAKAYAKDIQRELENKYGFTMKFDQTSTAREAFQRVNKMIDLREMFDELPEQLIVNICKACAAKGKPIRCNLTKAAYDALARSGGNGLTSPDNEIIFDYSPDAFGYAGTFAHELGHAAHNALPGFGTVKEKWSALNTAEYGTGSDAFITAYAGTSIYEDFAETFAVVAGARKGEHDNSIVRQKVELVRNFIHEAAGVDLRYLSGFDKTLNYGKPANWAADAHAWFEENMLSWGAGGTYEVRSDYNAGVQRCEFACALYRTLAALEIISPRNRSFDELCQSIRFNDVSFVRFYSGVTTKYDLNSIAELVSRGIINGTSETTFSPKKGITRQEAATMLYRALKECGYTAPQTEAVYSDSGDISSWAANAVNAMAETGIMSGVGDGKFDPQGVYTYNQTMVTLKRFYDFVQAAA